MSLPKSYVRNFIKLYQIVLVFSEITEDTSALSIALRLSGDEAGCRFKIRTFVHHIPHCTAPWATVVANLAVARQVLLGWMCKIIFIRDPLRASKEELFKLVRHVGPNRGNVNTQRGCPWVGSKAAPTLRNESQSAGSRLIRFAISD